MKVEEAEKRTPAIAIASHGCKLNQAEADALARRFYEAGYRVVDARQTADIYILNSCTVTQTADSKARQWLRGAHRLSPKALIVATGCYAQRAPEEIASIQGITLVVGNNDKEGLVDMVQTLRPSHGGAPLLSPEEETPIFYAARTRAFVKIQDGCNQFCSFCIIPFTRGRENNVPITRVVEEIKARVAEGYKEVVLTGPQIGSYGLYPPTLSSRNNPDYDGRLHGLVERILADTAIERLRLSSIQPQDLTPRLLACWADPRLCRHVHMALQSGSERVLKDMRRRYSLGEYMKAVEALRGAVPDIAITTDVMVGFPREGEEQFWESYEFCRRVGYAAMHVFSYSSRSGTMAAEMAHQVKESVKKERVGLMMGQGRRSAENFRRRFIGRRMKVLWEEEREEDGKRLWAGLTDNYIRVFTESVEPLRNRPTQVLLTDKAQEGLWGRLEESEIQNHSYMEE
ncbi:MAG: tRNA (N(6)-L-threonylcarbamoyladenosine(37)-C(2))-methylthiotransferase MtaB [Dehalococcoidia bacterium]